jgi:hypothetical protein
VTAVQVRRATDHDTDEIVRLSLRAWAPVFASFKAVFGDRLYRRVHPDWHTDQAAPSVRPSTGTTPGSPSGAPPSPAS